MGKTKNKITWEKVIQATFRKETLLDILHRNTHNNVTNDTDKEVNGTTF